MNTDVYDIDNSITGKLVWPKIRIEHNSRSYTDSKQIEAYDPKVHLLAQLLTAGAVTRVR